MFRSALNELYSCLQKNDATKESPEAFEKNVDSVVDARARVFDCEREYLVILYFFYILQMNSCCTRLCILI